MLLQPAQGVAPWEQILVVALGFVTLGEWGNPYGWYRAKRIPRISCEGMPYTVDT